MVRANFIDGHVLASIGEQGECVRDIFAVLPASGVGGVGRGLHHQDSAGTTLDKFRDCFRHEGMPVSVSEANSDVRAS